MMCRALLVQGATCFNKAFKLKIPLKDLPFSPRRTEVLEYVIRDPIAAMADLALDPATSGMKHFMLLPTCAILNHGSAACFLLTAAVLGMGSEFFCEDPSSPAATALPAQLCNSEFARLLQASVGAGSTALSANFYSDETWMDGL